MPVATVVTFAVVPASDHFTEDVGSLEIREPRLVDINADGVADRLSADGVYVAESFHGQPTGFVREFLPDDTAPVDEDLVAHLLVRDSNILNIEARCAEADFDGDGARDWLCWKVETPWPRAAGGFDLQNGRISNLQIVWGPLARASVTPVEFGTFSPEPTLTTHSSVPLDYESPPGPFLLDILPIDMTGDGVAETAIMVRETFTAQNSDWEVSGQIVLSVGTFADTGATHTLQEDFVGAIAPRVTRAMYYDRDAQPEVSAIATSSGISGYLMAHQRSDGSLVCPSGVALFPGEIARPVWAYSLWEPVPVGGGYGPSFMGATQSSGDFRLRRFRRGEGDCDALASLSEVPTMSFNAGESPDIDPISADFDRDGRLDVLYASSNVTFADAPLLYFASSDGSSEVLGLSDDVLSTAQVGDLNGDGHLDIIGTSGGRTRNVATGLGFGRFPTRVTFARAAGYTTGGAVSLASDSIHNQDWARPDTPDIPSTPAALALADVDPTGSTEWFRAVAPIHLEGDLRLVAEASDDGEIIRVAPRLGPLNADGNPTGLDLTTDPPTGIEIRLPLDDPQLLDSGAVELAVAIRTNSWRRADRSPLNSHPATTADHLPAFAVTTSGVTRYETVRSPHYTRVGFEGLSNVPLSTDGVGRGVTIEGDEVVIRTDIVGDLFVGYHRP